MFIINSLVIEAHYCGPSGSGNGGYSAGLVANNVPFKAEVTLRKPPPLDCSMKLVVDGKTAQLMDGEMLVAEAKEVAGFEMELPQPVGFEAAQKAAEHYLGYEHPPFPNCFVCGHYREHGQGLKIHPGRVEGGAVATPWIPYASLGNEKGAVKTPFIWAALDCPGAWAFLNHDKIAVLGRIAVQQKKEVKVEEPHVVMGWEIGNEGRKTWTGTAIFNEKKEVCAYAKATWITIKQQG